VNARRRNARQHFITSFDNQMKFWGIAMLALLSESLLSAQTFRTFDGDKDNDWGDKKNWSNDNEPKSSTEVAKFTTNAAGYSSIDIDKDKDVGGILFDAALTVDLTLTRANKELSILNGGASYGLINNSDQTITFQNEMEIEADMTWATTNVSGGGFVFENTIDTDDFDLTFNPAEALNTIIITGTIKDSGGIIKIGAGNLTLSGYNTYSGGTIVDDGTLTLTVGGGTGAIRGDLTVNSGATVEATATDAFGYSGGSKVTNVTVDGGTIINSIGSSNGNLGWANDYTLSDGALLTSNGGVSSTATNSNFTLNADSSINATSGTSTIAGRVNLRGDNGLNVDVTVASEATLDVTAGVTSSGGNTGFSKLGDGTLNLSGANTYNGLTDISAGTLVAQNSSALGSSTSGTTVATGATLQLENNINITAESLTVTGTGRLLNASGSNTYGGVISGTGELEVSGGQLTLSGTNDFSGAINVENGILTISSQENLGSLSGSADLTLNGGTLQIDGGSVDNDDNNRTMVLGAGGGIIDTVAISDTLIWDNGISGSGDFTKTGVGTFVFDEPTSFTGDLFINEGTVEFNGGNNRINDAVDVTIASGATLNVRNRSDDFGSLNGAGTLTADDTQTETVGFGLNDNANDLFSGTITDGASGTLNIEKLGTGNQTLSGDNDFEGTTTVVGGTLTLASDTTLGATSSGTTINSGATLSFTNNIDVGNEAIANSGIVTNTSGTNTFSGNISGAGTVTTDAGQLTLSGTNSYGGNTIVNSGSTLVLAADDALGSGGTTTVNSGGTLALQGNIRDANQTLVTIGGTGNSSAGAIQNIADVNTLSADVDLSADTTVTANAGTLNFGLQSAGDSPYLSNSIDLGSHTLTIDSDSGATVAFRYDITGTGGITKTGEGDLLLNNGWNTYTGDTNINDGKLILSPYTYSASFPSNFGLTSDVIVGDNIGTANSAIFQMGDGVESDPAEYIRDTQNITVNSDGYWNLQGFKETIANLTINGGTIDAQESGGSLNERLDVTGVITAGTGALSATSTINGLLGMNNDTAKSIVVNTGATLDIEANLSNGGFLKTGTGILELSGGNSFTGVAQIDAGIVRVNNDNGLGAVGSGAVGTGVTVTSTDAQLRLEDVTIGAEALSLTGDGVGGGGALRSESGTNSWGGTITLTGNAEIETASGSTLAISGNISGGGNTLTVEAIGNTLFTGINSFGTLEKTGAGTLTVTNTNTYGTANITDGEFALGATDILSNTMDLNVTGDGNFNVGNFNETVRDINGNGTVTVNSGGNLVIDNLGNTGTGFKGTLDIDGTMTLNGGLISGGTGAGSTGEMILTSGNTLEIASDYTFGTVGTTGGSDQLGTLTLADNATLLISGNSVVNIGTLNIAGDSILDFTTGADSNTLNLGSLTFEAGASLTVNGWNSFGDLWTTQNFPGATLDIRDDDTAKITFNGFTNDQTIWLTSDFGSKEITVPEPSSYGALLMAFALAAWSLRRRPDPPRAGESTMTNGTPAIYGNGHGINDSFRAS